MAQLVALRAGASNVNVAQPTGCDSVIQFLITQVVRIDADGDTAAVVNRSTASDRAQLDFDGIHVVTNGLTGRQGTI